MSAPDREKPLRGLAGSIDALFTALERSRDADEGGPETEGDAEGADGTRRRRAPASVASADPFMDVEVLPHDEPAGGAVGIADLAPDEGEAGELEAVSIADLAPEEEPAPTEAVSIADLAPDEDEGDELEAVSITDLAPEEESAPTDPVSIADLAPEAPEEEPVRIEDLSPVGEPVGIADLAPDEEVAEVEPASIADLAPAEEVPSAAPAEPEPASLPTLVEEYLTSGGARRDELSRRIRTLATRAEEDGGAEAVCDAIERLVIAGRRNEQDPPISLGRLLATPPVTEVLTSRLGTARDEERRAQLIEVAGALGDRMASAVGQALATAEDRAARRAYMEGLVAMGDGAREVVSGMVDDDRWYVVRNAALVLGEIGDEETVQRLAGALVHDDPRVRRETVLAFAKLGGKDASVLVRGKVEDPDPHVRAAAALAVGELHVERGARVLAGRLADEGEEGVQVALIRALGHLRDPGAVPVLEKRAVGGFFSRGPTDVRVAAYRALGAIGTPRARKLLEDAVDDRDPAVRSAAEAALEAS